MLAKIATVTVYRLIGSVGACGLQTTGGVGEVGSVCLAISENASLRVLAGGRDRVRLGPRGGERLC